MNVLRCVVSLSAACSVIVAFILQASQCSAVVVLAPLAVVGGLYGLWTCFELLFALAVFVKLRATLHDQHLRRQAAKSQRLGKARP